MKKLLLPLILMGCMAFGQVDSVKINNKPFCKNKKEHVRKVKQQRNYKRQNRKQHNRKYRAGRVIVRVIVIGGIGYYVGYTVGKNK